MPMIDVVYPRIVDIHTATCLNSGTANTDAEHQPSPTIFYSPKQ